MKRALFLVLILIFGTTSTIHATAWGWWSPTITEPQSSGWEIPMWPQLPTLPEPNLPSNPTPTQPGDSKPPLQPVEPSNPGQQIPLPSPSLTGEEQNLINQVNQERIKNGLKSLQVDYGLVALAKEKSHDMALNSYFDHVSPTLGTVYSMLDRAGVSYSRAGENIARTGSIARAHPLFMNSSAHRANIMHSGYTHIGVGIVKQGTSYHITQIFIKK